MSTSSPQTPSPSPSMLKGASLLIILQLLSRLFTFAANQLLLRYLTAPLLGLSAQLEVYYLSVLFFARESLRVAIQRQGVLTTTNTSSATTPSSEKATDGSNDKIQQEASVRLDSSVAEESQAVTNLGYLSIFLGIPVAILLGYLYLRYSDPLTLSATPYLTTSLYMYGIASVLELLSEPCFVLLQSRLEFGTRARAESLATFLRCAVLFCSAMFASRRKVDLGVLPFALGQIIYGGTVLLVYLISGWKLSSVLKFSLLLAAPVRRIDSRKDNTTTNNKDDGGNTQDQFLIGGLFYKPTVTLAGSMMAQSLVKHVLTQGDTFLVSTLSTPQVQGVYALANNYGSLVARLLLQPVEESSRSYLSRLLASSPEGEPQIQNTATTSPQPIQQARQTLHVLLRSYLLFSLPICLFGPPASPHLLRIVAGPQWAATAGPVLALYALYIPFLALNGLTESFVASVATEAEIYVQSGFMFIFTLIFAGNAWLFMGKLGLGARGLVLANAANMACRILWSWIFMSRWFKSRNVGFESAKCVPWTAVLFSGATALGLRWLDGQGFGPADEKNSFMALIKIGATAVPLLLILVGIERRFIIDAIPSSFRKTKRH